MKKKFKFDIKSFFNKKENMALLVIAVVCCAGIAVSGIKSNDIPLHDGDVLVDSQAVETAEKKEEKGGEEQGKAAEGSFEEQRASLELDRQNLISKYDETIKNGSSKAEKKNAEAQKQKLMDCMEQEVSVENLLKTKELPDCLVIITENRVTVTVDAKELNQTEAAKICSIVMEETGRSAEGIVIQSRH